MRCAIMQPTFLPWAGYFRLLRGVDNFVFLDCVQLVRRSWQTRNRILVQGRASWITVPVQNEGREKTIAEAKISGEHWRKKLVRTLRHSYARHPYASELTDLVELIDGAAERNLADLNIRLISFCATRLGVQTPLRRSTNMHLVDKDKLHRLLSICHHLCCDTYVSPIGSAAYLDPDTFSDKIKLEFFCFSPPSYLQRGISRFVPRLSIVDVVANLGWAGAAAYIQT